MNEKKNNKWFLSFQAEINFLFFNRKNKSKKNSEGCESRRSSLRLLYCVILRLRLRLAIFFGVIGRGRVSFLVCSSLKDMVIVAFDHKELRKMVLAVQDSIKSSIRTVCQMASTMSTSKALFVVAFSLQCNLIKNQK